MGRQPIFDERMEVVGYEILYRSGTTNRAQFDDPELATSQVLLNTFVDFGIERILQDSVGFVNMTRQFILDRHAFSLPPKQLVVEVLEDVEVDDELTEALQELSSAGYQIALDDFVFAANQEALLPFADIVKVDLRQVSPRDLGPLAASLKARNLRLLAEKVETHDEFHRCRRLGFELFQGYFLSRPEVLQSRQVASSRAQTLQLLSQLHDPDVSFKRLSDLISQDVSISYRLLKLLNSSFYGLPRQVESVHEGLVYIGLDQIVRWVSLIALASVDGKPRELLNTGLVRARMAELIGRDLVLDNNHRSFTVGLFSVLDALLDRPMEEIISEIPLSSEAADALVGHQGNLGMVLEAVLAFERGEWDHILGLGLEAGPTTNAFLDAVDWAGTAMGQAGV